MGKKTKRSKVIIKAVLNNGNSVLPTRQHKGDAGFDLTSIDTGTIKPGYSTVFGTGLHVEVPEGFVMLVFPRSGLGIKHGVTLSNSVGVVDSGYRGEVKVGLVNLGKDDVTIHTGDRIAQAIVIELPKTKFVESFVLGNSLDGRDTDGFGSTDEPKEESTEQEEPKTDKPEEEHHGNTKYDESKFSTTLSKNNPVEYTDRTNSVLKFMNPMVAAIFVLALKGEKNPSRVKLNNYAQSINRSLKNGSKKGLVLGIPWRKSIGADGAMTAYDLDYIPDSLKNRRRGPQPFSNRHPNADNRPAKGSVTTRKPRKDGNRTRVFPVKAYIENMAIRTFKSIDDAVVWLNNNQSPTVHYRTNISRVVDTDRTAYGYSWRSASVNWVA